MSLMKSPSHPGRVLKSLYLEPLGLSEGQLARALLVPRTRIERLVAGKSGMTTDTAMRLARFFDTTPQYWLNLQTNYEIAHAKVDVSAIAPLSPAA